MHENLEIFRLSGGLARHAAARQELVARNTAHADTPGYRSQDLPAFAESYRSADGAVALQTSRPGHMVGANGAAAAPRIRPVDAPGTTSPNGNTVSLETEMVRAAEVRHTHELALSVYQSALSVLRTSLGRGR